jgi:outer membrane protein OmpA-like peptidoglycan-associated protein
MRLHKLRHSRDVYSFWPGIADLFLAAMMVAMFLWFGETFRSMLIQAYPRASPKRTTSLTVKPIVDPKDGIIGGLQAKNDTLSAGLDAAEKELAAIKRPPPIIDLDEAKGVVFDAGSARPTTDLAKIVAAETLAKLREAITRYKINVIEVIGHTDEKPLWGVQRGGRKRRLPSIRSAGRGNLDEKLESVLAGASSTILQPASNVDLGLARAAVIAEQLRAILANKPEFAGIKVRCYSAAQGIVPATALTETDLKKRDALCRRIELRFVKSAEE